MTSDLWKLSATALMSHLSRGEVSAREATLSVLKRIDDTNPTVNALASVSTESALKAADTADATLQRGEALGHLHGVPVTIKVDRKSTRLNSSHVKRSRMPSSA